ncbi:MAG: hypothetical protein IT319_16745, partial [Anaerolineae bacterium]|nr:hypothetical protein [Anaerolineae bacterium]
DFAWQESASKAIRRHLTEDGELSGEIRAMMAENRLQRMSLDDLLEEQEAAEPPDAEQNQQASRR